MKLLIAIIRYFNYLDCPDEDIKITVYWHQFAILAANIVGIILIITIK